MNCSATGVEMQLLFVRFRLADALHGPIYLMNDSAKRQITFATSGSERRHGEGKTSDGRLRFQAEKFG